MRLRAAVWLAVVIAAIGPAPWPVHAASGDPASLGLVGYWPLDEGQGDRAVNLASMGGNLFGSTGDALIRDGEWASGRFGSCLQFSRGGRGLRVELLRELECAEAVTVAAWIKLGDDPQPNALIWSRERAYRLALDPQGQRRIRFQLALDGKWAGNWLLSKSALQPGRWTHVAGVYDGRERLIYIDGQLDARAPAVGAISRGDNTSIGRDFAGQIDEVRVWSRALSAEELARAASEDAAQYQAALSPAEALRLYPMRVVGMLGQNVTLEVALFNAATTLFSATAKVQLLSSEGATAAEDTRPLSITPRGTVRLSLSFLPQVGGEYVLTVSVDGRECFRTPVYVMSPRPRGKPGPLNLQPVVSVDLGHDLGPEQLCEDGTNRIADSPLGRYREAGAARGARFVVRLPLRRPGLHLLRVRYPDDKPRTGEVVTYSPAEPDIYNVQTGYLTGAPYAVTDRIQTLDCLFWARDVNQAVIFTTREAGRPAAAASVEVFEVAGGLPPSPAAAVPGKRQIGLYWEDAAPLPWCVGADGTSLEDFDRAVGNLCDLMDYSGENVLFHPAVWYDGPIYHSLVEETGLLGGRDMPAAGWLDILLKRFAERGLKLYATLNVHQLPSLSASGNADVDRVRAGEPTPNAVTRDGRVVNRTWHNQPPAYNALHPQVQARVLALVSELAERYGDSPAFSGVALHLTRCQLLQLGGLDTSYDDWSVTEFQKDTGLTVPVDTRDPDRFAKRYEWIMAHARDQWIAWRCARLARYYGKAARILTTRRADLRLVAVVLHPLPAVHTDLRQRWEQGTRLADLSREAGVDPALLGQQPGITVVKHMGPSDYRFCLAGQPGRDQALLSVRGMDLAADQLRDYRTIPDFGVFLYNRYFESARDRRGQLACSWYRDPGWIAAAIVPGGDSFMEYYAHALAATDAALIVTGGFTLGTTGHEAQVERFARAFRELPVGQWQDAALPGTQAVARTLQDDADRYLYVVNPSAAAIRITLPSSLFAEGARPLGGSPVPLRGTDGWTVELGPYELAAWAWRGTLRSGK